MYGNDTVDQRMSIGLGMLTLQEDGVYQDHSRSAQADFDLISREGLDDPRYQVRDVPVRDKPYLKTRWNRNIRRSDGLRNQR